MSTRSRIAIKTSDNEFKSIYCHWDGYPSNNGALLLKHYNSKELTLNLIDLGDLSRLSESIEKPENHTFDSPIEGYSVAYGRDRGDTGVNAVKHHSLTNLVNTSNRTDAEWIYLFDVEQNKWLFMDNKKSEKCKKDLNNWLELTSKNTKK